MKIATLVIGLCLVALLGACDTDYEARGFSLPEGDPDAGEATFLRLECTDCHNVVGRAELRAGVENPELTVPLGGPTTRIITYGHLVTSIINPSHRISHKYRIPGMEKDGESRMRNYNAVMTVEELINLVAFLEQQYELETYARTPYPTIY